MFKLSDTIKKMPQDVPKNYIKNMSGLLQNGTTIQSISSIWGISWKTSCSWNTYFCFTYFFVLLIYSSYCFISKPFYVTLFTSKLMKGEKAGKATCYPQNVSSLQRQAVIQRFWLDLHFLWIYYWREHWQQNAL